MPKKTGYIVAAKINGKVCRSWSTHASDADGFGKALKRIADTCPQAGITAVFVGEVFSSDGRVAWGEPVDSWL